MLIQDFLELREERLKYTPIQSNLIMLLQSLFKKNVVTNFLVVSCSILDENRFT